MLVPARRPANSAALDASTAMPSRCAARRTSAGSPAGSTAAIRSSRRRSAGSGASRRWKLSSIRSDSRLGVRQSETTREFGVGQPMGQLQQRERVAPRLGQDSVAHPLVERTRDRRREQLSGVTGTQTAERQLRQSEQRPAGRPPRESRTPARPTPPQPPSDEREGLRGRAIEPLRVVDHAEERALGRGLREQAEHGQPEQEAVGRRTDAQTEGRTDRILLPLGDVGQPVQQRRAQLVQPRERQLRLGLHACRLHHPVAVIPPDQVLEQRRLADPGLTPDDEGSTDAAAHAGKEFVELPALFAPTHQHGAEHSRGPVVSVRLAQPSATASGQPTTT